MNVGVPAAHFGNPFDPLLLTFHGGNFSGGSYRYDVNQNTALSKAGFFVVQPDFPKTLRAFTEWMESDEMQRVLTARSVSVLGRSSGAYLAKLFARTYPVLHAYYLAPVFDPESRAAIRAHSLKIKNRCPCLPLI